MKGWGIVVVLCLLVVGCSTKFIYNKLDWLAIRYMEDFVELNDKQETLVRDKIKQLMHWHTRSELPLYIDHLDELIALNPKTFSRKDLQQHRQKLQAHSNRLLVKLEPDILDLAKRLSDEQAEELMNNIRVRHTRYKKKYQDLSPDEIQSVYAEKLEENFAEWFGSLTDEQRQIIDQWSQEILITQPDWINHQIKMRIEINKLLEHRKDQAYFPQHLKQLLFEPQSYFSSAFMQKREYNQTISEKHFVRMVQSATHEQVEYYRSELKDWKEVVLSLR